MSDSSATKETSHGPEITAGVVMCEALREAENVLTDYIETIEKTGASLNYGRSVLRQIRAAIVLYEGC